MGIKMKDTMSRLDRALWIIEKKEKNRKKEKRKGLRLKPHI